MKANIALLIGAAAVCSALVGCSGGGSDDSMTSSAPSPPPPPKTITLDTAGVLAIVQLETSESSTPFQVDDAAVALTPVGDETSAPLSVDAT
jgi:hypothetical protein